ncbi:RNA polymerase sigma-70 factor [Dyadobacter psychrotolerans]|uniref:RNA polymerase sigma-70 factor n=1 Tax=Dyadobacter psychrotolerans TaxID=2541721 RepID=A0A4R5DH68_9BACT|nr:RNA polymerase sigma-70 factor [Dyadobacter psychrotolerans]TDE13366.1 RNA polymerase sigma-70 factor [Dyadobacter psychrotolerans]
MQDPLLSEDLQSGNLFHISTDDSERPQSREMSAALFLKTTFEENPGKGLELLFRRFYNPLCSHAVRFVYSKQIAEDLVSEVFFQFYRTRAYENITSSYTSYLFRSVRNECYTYMRREFGKTDSLDTSAETTISTYHQQPDAEIHYNNLFLKVNEVIGKLPTQCQRVFLMSRFENKKYNEIADELHISPKTVEVHISKALKYLRSALRGEWMISWLLTLLTSCFVAA